MGGWTVVGTALKQPRRIVGMVMAGTIGGIFLPEMQNHFLPTRPIPLNVEPPIGSLPTYADDYLARRPDKTFLYDEIRLLGAQPPADGMPRIISLRQPIEHAREHLQMPILCIVGEQDVLMPPGAVGVLADSLPNARMVTVPDCGHSTYFEQPEIFNQNVLGFLRSIGYGTSN